MNSQILKGHISALRRFSRMISGNNLEADRHLLTALGSLLNEQRTLSQFEDRKSIYKWFVASIDSHSASEAGFSEAPLCQTEIDRDLQQLAFNDRLAFLLTVVEGFSEKEAAEIIGLEAEQVRMTVKQASAYMSESMKPSLSTR